MQRIPEIPRTASGLLAGAEPFSHLGARTGVLLVHGFTSTPYDLRACGDYLHAHGLAVEAPLLAGHGTAPEDLAQTRLGDWLGSIQAATHRLRSRCDRVFALGISLSGNFLLSLAPDLRYDGLILVGTPLRFRYERGYRAAYRVLRALGVEYQRKWYHDALAEEIRRRRPTYRHFPLACAPDCLRAVERSRQQLALVQCPVLILQSTRDHAVDARTVSELAASLRSEDITVRWYADRYHVLVVDRGAEDVFADIAAFIETRARPPGSRLRAPAPPALFAQPAGSGA